MEIQFVAAGQLPQSPLYLKAAFRMVYLIRCLNKSTSFNEVWRGLPTISNLLGQKNTVIKLS